MATIGAFKKTAANEYTGEIDNAPDYRVHRGSEDDGPEVGAGWKRTGARVGDYVAVSLDDPALAQPLWANLFPTDAERVTFVLSWNRPARREDGR